MVSERGPVCSQLVALYGRVAGSNALLPVPAPPTTLVNPPLSLHDVATLSITFLLPLPPARSRQRACGSAARSLLLNHPPSTLHQHFSRSRQRLVQLAEQALRSSITERLNITTHQQLVCQYRYNRSSDADSSLEICTFRSLSLSISSPVCTSTVPPALQASR